MPTRDQQRAARAYGTIVAVHRSTVTAEFRAKYGGICLKMPTMIQHNGLCQAISFYEAKAGGARPEDDEKALYLRDLSRLAFANDEVTASMLENRARNDDLDAYLLLSREVIRCAEWLKRYAEAVLKVKQGVEPVGEGDAR